MTTNIDGEPFSEEAYRRLANGTITEYECDEITKKMDIINDDLFSRTRIQAKSGSKIITYSEFNVQTFSYNEQKVLDEACKIAREENIYLVFPFEVIETDLTKRIEPELFQVNKSVMITPKGEVAYQYLKHNLLIGSEIEHTIRGEREIQYIDTPYGRLSSVICLDMEYPDFMRLAGQNDVDIILSGAIDGTKATKGNPLHSIMASYRTIESGFSLGRAGFYGQNVAVDYLGNFKGKANHYTASDRTVTAHIPIKGTKTLYTKLGDFFPWLSMLFLLIISLITTLFRAKKNR